MILSIEKIKEITRGAVRIDEEADGIHFRRFTKEQEALYLNVRTIFAAKSQATSGMRMEFRTNSKSLTIKTSVTPGSSRSYFCFEIFVNGKCQGRLANFEVGEERDYITGVFETGRFEKTFALGEGEKDVCIYFPWSAKTVIEEISVDDEAYIQSTGAKKKFLFFGDSITQGYDALSPSLRYPARIVDAFGMEEVNKAIGGEVYCEELVKGQDDLNPDYILVAYGTNDWGKSTKDSVKENCEGFYKYICARYPDIPIFTLTPIWRKDENEEHAFGEFHEVAQLIRDTVAPYKNVTLIEGYDLVPKDGSYYLDGYLHPSNEGFEHYFQHLYQELKEKVQA